jgi:exodeoxyribonuclease VII small subunit
MAKKKVKAKTASDDLSFEQALASLAAVVERLESGELSLDESLASYEKGVGLLKACHRQLARAERRIEVLRSVDSQGEAEVAQYDDRQDDSLDEKQASRARRRSQPGDESRLF